MLTNLIGKNNKLKSSLNVYPRENNKGMKVLGGVTICSPINFFAES